MHETVVKIATILTMLLYLQLYPDINVLTQEIGACAIHFLHENIKNQLSGYGKNN